MNDDCHVDQIQKTVTAEERETVVRALLAVWGMGCPNCAMRVRNSLVMLEGVIDAYVDHTVGVAQVMFNHEDDGVITHVWMDHTVGVAHVMFNPDMLPVSALIQAVARAGNDARHEYRAVLMALRLT